MKRKTRGMLALVAAAAILSPCALAKKALDHQSFDDWKLVRNHLLSNDGQWGAYSINPQAGDGKLVFFQTSNGRKIEIERGHTPSFTADGRWAVARVKPHFADTRKAKIDKKKDFDLPQDSLAIVDLRKGTVVLIPEVISYAVGKEGGDWVAYLSCDTTLITPKALKDKEAGRPLVVRHLPTGTSKTLRWAKDYVFSEDGTRLGVTLKHHESDSTAIDGLGMIALPDTSFVLLDRGRRHYGRPVFSWQADRLASIVSNDSADSGTRTSTLLLADLTQPHATPAEYNPRHYPHGRVNLAIPHAADSLRQDSLMARWREANRRQEMQAFKLNQYSTPQFSLDGKRIIVGIAPSIAPNDTTIVDFEQPELDIWRWDAPLTPPQELKEADKLRKHTFPIVIDLADGSERLITSNPLATVEGPWRWNGRWALVHDPSEAIVSHQWDYYAPEEVSLFDITDGTSLPIGKVYKETAELSPEGKFVVWFDDKDWFTFDPATGETHNLTKGIDVTFWDETDDHPMVPQPYGLAGWSAADKDLLVYDRFDIWSLDPTGGRAPFNLTRGEGRKANRKLRWRNAVADRRFISPGETMLIEVFDYADKRNGLAELKFGSGKTPVLKTLEERSFTQIREAKNKPVLSFVKANFSVLPDVYVASSGNLASPRRLSEANPQVKDYNWGTAELYRWRAYNGELTDGVLYKPEDFDPNKKYPMLCVFYETGSEDLYTHYTMEPSWSWVNYPFYVSRGYVVFVPDIHYTPGLPGESAYTYVCSGVEDLCNRYDWIDRDRIGIDGQSWGGYQTAYLVTRTNMFACAGSGAPVSNMTSAYGGIRWGTGDSRQAQYEMGQSRIGRNLWEAPELYVANSPVFHANRVHTPLLIMHNDQDGAVPWYQGIEMFMALRRLGKPVWMLQYNGEAHNLRERKNRKDITIRLQQFFDHYLKGDPMPEWMKNGIPVVRKGQELGY